MSLLARLKSKPKPAPFALDALDLSVLRHYKNGFTMTRSKGMELPAQWDATWRLVENGYMFAANPRKVGGRIMIYSFTLSPKGNNALNPETTK